jgi:hypothetical protein
LTPFNPARQWRPLALTAKETLLAPPPPTYFVPPPPRPLLGDSRFLDLRRLTRAPSPCGSPSESQPCLQLCFLLLRALYFFLFLNYVADARWCLWKCPLCKRTKCRWLRRCSCLFETARCCCPTVDSLYTYHLARVSSRRIIEMGSGTSCIMVPVVVLKLVFQLIEVLSLDGPLVVKMKQIHFA